MNLRKKGFTLVELVIVIAVVAILATVLIPTFTSLINKANMSSDQVAVRDMNTILAIEKIDDNDLTIEKVKEILEEAGYRAEDYRPLTNGATFYWIKNLNKIVLYNEEASTVIYPTNIEDNLIFDENTWFSLISTPEVDPNRLYREDVEQDIPVAKLSSYTLAEGESNGSNATIAEQLYAFRTTDDNSEKFKAQRDYYADWYADFAIILHDDFDARSGGICGQFWNFPWIDMDLETDLKSGTTILLLMDTPLEGWEITYEYLVEACNKDENNDNILDSFNCGAFNLSSDNIGKSITVELRLYQPENGKRGKKYVVCNEVNCTFVFSK